MVYEIKTRENGKGSYSKFTDNFKLSFPRKYCVVRIDCLNGENATETFSYMSMFLLVRVVSTSLPCGLSPFFFVFFSIRFEDSVLLKIS